jgi:hypothetical protein
VEDNNTGMLRNKDGVIRVITDTGLVLFHISRGKQRFLLVSVNKEFDE